MYCFIYCRAQAKRANLQKFSIALFVYFISHQVLPSCDKNFSRKRIVVGINNHKSIFDTIIMNQTLKTGIFPEALKIAKAIKPKLKLHLCLRKVITFV